MELTTTTTQVSQLVYTKCIKHLWLLNIVIRLILNCYFVRLHQFYTKVTGELASPGIVGALADIIQGVRSPPQSNWGIRRGFLNLSDEWADTGHIA